MNKSGCPKVQLSAFVSHTKDKFPFPGDSPLFTFQSHIVLFKDNIESKTVAVVYSGPVWHQSHCVGVVEITTYAWNTTELSVAL